MKEKEQEKLFEKGYIGTKFIERDEQKYIRFNKSIDTGLENSPVCL